MEVVLPLITLASLALIVLGYNRFRGLPINKGFVSSAFGLVAFAGSAALVGWAVDDSSRLVALLVVVVGVAVFALIQVGKHRAGPRPSTAKPPDHIEFL